MKEKISLTIQRIPKVSWRNVIDATIIWLIANLLIGFLISQGSSESSYYIGIIYIVFILSGIYFAMRKHHFHNVKSALSYSIILLVTFALLDFLVINLLFEGNSGKIYSQWYIGLSYAVAVITPIIYTKMLSADMGIDTKIETEGLTT